MSDTVKLHIEAGIATVTMNRPDQLNAMGTELLRGLETATARIAESDGVQVIILQGAGQHFAAGGDIKEFETHLHLAPELRYPAYREMIVRWANGTVLNLRSLPQPVIAKVQGACAGFGMSLALGCDLVIAADTATFTTAYAQLGVSGDGGITWLLPRLVGERRASELMLLAERLTATQARELGLINRVIAEAELDVATLELAHRLQRGARYAYGRIKHLVNTAWDATLPEQLEAEAEGFARCTATEDFGEGVRAFIAKRKPQYRGI